MKSDIGSKSESLQPYLYVGGGDMIRLFKAGDNPFENETMKPFDAMKVSIVGECDENGVLWVDTIAMDKETDEADKQIDYKNNIGGEEIL